MKQLIAIFTSILLIGFSANATTTENIKTNSIATSSVRGYGNSFIFQEEGIEFSIFPDGQFDFYMTNYGPNLKMSINAGLTSISFNTGYDYNAYVQYDEFGAIVQIEHIPVYYDYYGRVRQVGNVCINYNNFGFVSQVGGLYVHYNRFNRFSHCSGFINIFNRFYVARPWHSFYRIPHFNHCVVYNRPYRQYYRPIRHHYTRPYVNNHRRRTAVASRHGNTINRRSELATRGNNSPRNTESYNTVRPRRGNEISNTRAKKQNTPRPRVTTNTPRTTIQNTPKPRVTTSTPRTGVKATGISSSTRSNRQITRPSRSQNKASQRSKSSRNLKYNKSKNSSSNRIASNTRKRR
jgi:hypothetical protein